MATNFLYEGVNVSYEQLLAMTGKGRHLVATWLTEHRSGPNRIRSRVEYIKNENDFLRIVKHAKKIAGIYHLRFFATNVFSTTYFDYNPAKDFKFIDRRTPHWKVIDAFDRARFTSRPDDISVLTKQRLLTIPWCEPFALVVGYEWHEVVPALHIRRVADAEDELKFRVFDVSGNILEVRNVKEPQEWGNLTKVLQLRRSPTRQHETEFRYKG